MSHLTPAGYNFEDRRRPGDEGYGGVGLLYRKMFSCKRKATQSFDSMQLLSVRLSSSSTRLFDLCIMYRPPSGSIRKFWDQLEQLLCTMKRSKESFVLLGDFNPRYNAPGVCKKLQDLLNQFMLTQHVKTANRKGVTSWTLRLPRPQTEL